MDEEALPAGRFGEWLAAMEAALRDERPSDVPCGECTACCTSSQFVHIAPDETDTLEHIPRELLFPAPRMPKGHVLLGYDRHGRCPMLVDGACSIYEHRPRTCRVYDCRIFPATGVVPDEDKPHIAERAARWYFDHPGELDHELHAACRAAATFLAGHADAIPEGVGSGSRQAVLAVAAHRAFLGPAVATVESVRVELTRRVRPQA